MALRNRKRQTNKLKRKKGERRGTSSHLLQLMKAVKKARSVVSKIFLFQHCFASIQITVKYASIQVWARNRSVTFDLAWWPCELIWTRPAYRCPHLDRTLLTQGIEYLTLSSFGASWSASNCLFSFLLHVHKRNGRGIGGKGEKDGV